MKAFAFVALLSLGCHRAPDLETQLEEWDYVDWSISAYVVWDADSEAHGFEVGLGRRPRGYSHIFNAGRLRGYFMPPILSLGERWHFAVRTYDDRGRISEWSNEVSKFE